MYYLNLLCWNETSHLFTLKPFGFMLFQPYPQNLFLKGKLWKNVVYQQAKRKSFCLIFSLNKVEAIPIVKENIFKEAREEWSLAVAYSKNSLVLQIENTHTDYMVISYHFSYLHTKSFLVHFIIANYSYLRDMDHANQLIFHQEFLMCFELLSSLQCGTWIQLICTVIAINQAFVCHYLLPTIKSFNNI